MNDNDEEHEVPNGEDESRLFALNKALTKEVDKVGKEKVELEREKAVIESTVKELQSFLEVEKEASNRLNQREVEKLTEERDSKIGS